MQSLIDRALQSRRIIFQAAVIATLIALGINLISSWLAIYFEKHPFLLFMSGGLFTTIGFLYFVRQLLKDRHHSYKVDGAIFLDPQKREAIEADDYIFSENLVRTLKAAFIENEALKTAWEIEMFPEEPPQEKISNAQEKEINKNEEIQYFSIVKIKSDEEELETRNSRVLIEAIEFCFLDYLSLHLSDYFDHREHDSRQVHIIERENIPHMVLANRILSLLTTPIEDRQIFTKAGMNKNRPKEGEIHAIYGTNGAVYERFYLNLPIDTVISRPSAGHLTLEHPRFHMSIQINYQGFTETLPTYFSDLYISDTIDEIDAKKVDILISATLRPLAFLHVSGWEYYEWIDSFFEFLKERGSFTNFLEKICWDSVSTSIRANVIRERRIKNKQEENKEN